jgi:hypothetical protein
VDEIINREVPQPVGHGEASLRPRLTAASLLSRWRSVPVVDASAIRSDLDAVLDAAP